MKQYVGHEFIKATGIIKIMFSNGSESVSYRVSKGRTDVTPLGKRVYKRGAKSLYCSNLTLFMKDESIRPCVDVINVAIAQGCDEFRMRIWTPIRKGTGREYRGYFKIKMADIVATWAQRLTQHMTNPMEQQVKIDLDELELV